MIDLMWCSFFLRLGYSIDVIVLTEEEGEFKESFRVFCPWFDNIMIQFYLEVRLNNYYLIENNNETKKRDCLSRNFDIFK